MQTCLEGRAGSKEKQKESNLWRKRGFRVKIPAEVKIVDRIVNAWKSFNFYCRVIWSGLEEADGDYGVAKGSPLQPLLGVTTICTALWPFGLIKPKSCSASFPCGRIYFSPP